MLINRKSREGYGRAVDWWSLGTLVYEMLTGWPPFYDKNLRKMCEQILRSELAFPPGCSASPEARDLIRGLLMRDPAQRLGSSRTEGADEIRRHPFFKGLDWAELEARRVEPPFRPRPAGSSSGGDAAGRLGSDTANFDATFTSEPAVLTPPEPSELVRAPVCCCVLVVFALRGGPWRSAACVRAAPMPPTLAACLRPPISPISPAMLTRHCPHPPAPAHRATGGARGARRRLQRLWLRAPGARGAH